MRAALFQPFILLMLLACGRDSKHVSVGSLPVASAADPALDTAAAYRMAIAEYISALRMRDGGFPDTLYIGRHDQFPEIELPPIIEQTLVRIVTPAEAKAVENGEHFRYLNVLGWFSGDKVEFMVIAFKQGMRHRPDGVDDRHVYYSIGISRTEFALDSLR